MKFIGKNGYVLKPKKHYKEMRPTELDMSDGLFDACWRQYRAYLNGSIDNPGCDEDVYSWLEEIAKEKVNSPNSKFYMYG